MNTLRAIQQALDQIEAKLAAPLPIAELARGVGMSLWHFQRSFSAIVGEPVGRYLRRRRIARAAKRLFDFDGTLLDLALECQFESHEAFTRAFKAELSVTPSDWRDGRGAIRYPRRREIVSQESIDQRYLAMNLQPEIVTLPPAAFVGLEARFISATSDNANNLSVIPRLWDAFFQRVQEISSDEPGAFYGLCQSLESRGAKREHPDEALYLAAARVAPEARIPEGMTRWNSPGGRFAKFEHRGRIEKIGETMAGIYGKWFPESGYEPGNGPDLERYDEHFDPTSDASALEILIPVAERESGG